MSVRFVVITALGLGLAAGASPALAKGPKHCPPGLAKKAVPCVPPGQAKKYDRAYGDDDLYYRIMEHGGYRAGDRYRWDGRYDRFRDYDRYRLPRLRENEAYYRDGNVLLRVDNETRRVIELIRLADIVLGN